MTTEQSPAAKLGDLIEQLESSIDQYEISTSEALARAYATGTDWQLEACCDYLMRCAAWEPEDIQEMRDLLRPKPPSLKQQALQALANADGADYPVVVTVLNADQHALICKALEQLDD